MYLVIACIWYTYLEELTEVTFWEENQKGRKQSVTLNVKEKARTSNSAYLLASKETIESCPNLLCTLTKYFIGLEWLWHVIKLNAGQNKGTILVCPTRSCIFRGLSKGCRPAPSHSPIHSSLIFPKFSTFVHLIRWGIDTLKVLQSEIWPLPFLSLLQKMLNSCYHSWLQLPMGDLNRDPPLSDHLLL